MILFITPHSKKFVSDRQAGLAWPGLAGLVDFVVVLVHVVHPLNYNCFAVFNACTTCPKWYARVPPLPT